MQAVLPHVLSAQYDYLCTRQRQEDSARGQRVERLIAKRSVANLCKEQRYLHSSKKGCKVMYTMRVRLFPINGIQSNSLRLRFLWLSIPSGYERSRSLHVALRGAQFANVVSSQSLCPELLVVDIQNVLEEIKI